jgi:integrase
MKINKKTVESAILPSGKGEATFWDDDIPGFGLRIRQGGSRSLIFQYRVGRKQRKLALGTATALNIDAARKEASRVHARIKLGDDPAGQKIEARAKAAETFGQILQPYLDHKRRELRPRSFEQVARHLGKHARTLHGRQLAKIDRRSIAALVTAAAANSGPTEANHVRKSLSALFAWAMGEGLVDANPVIATNPAVVNGGRERVLSDAEIRKIWNAVGDSRYGVIVKLLMLTGQRREEIGGLRRREIDLEKAVISLPGERTKNKRPHDIPLSGPALALLKAHLESIESDRDHVFGGSGKAGFAGWRKEKAALDQKIALSEPWVLHDVRRTFSTKAHEDLNIAPHIIEAVLNHVSGHRAGVAGIYNRALYAREKRAVLAQWADYVQAAIEGRKMKVVPLRA